MADPPNILSAVQVPPGTIVAVTWSTPLEGAPVIGYIVHYTGGDDVGSVAVSSSSTSTDISGLTNDGRIYIITVEALSEHVSGESDAAHVVLCTFTLYNYSVLKTIFRSMVELELSKIGNGKCAHKCSWEYCVLHYGPT